MEDHTAVSVARIDVPNEYAGDLSDLRFPSVADDMIAVGALPAG